MQKLLVWSIMDVLLPNTQLAHRPSLAQKWFEQPLLAEHGFSVLLKLEINGMEHKLLFDSGLSPLVAAYNADVLNLDLSYCEAVISSHGHIDHAGGLLNIRKKMNTKQNIPLLLHKHAFRNRLVKFQDGRMISLPPPVRHILNRAGYNIVEKNAPSLWMKDSVLVTGEVPRTTDFEKGFPNHYS
jgi:7,8-dihydropterin-6-yl-methyl-4-(beta-D-ribofuranosyl)aminobenzene 5'-phosphate synthase